MTEPTHALRESQEEASSPEAVQPDRQGQGDPEPVLPAEGQASSQGRTARAGAEEKAIRLKAEIAQTLYEAATRHERGDGWVAPWAEAASHTKDLYWRLADAVVSRHGAVL